MLKKQILISVITIIILLTSCTDESPLISDIDQIIVWAYLYAGEPVTSIKLTSTIPLDTDLTDVPPINDAMVTLIKEGEQYECIPSPGDSGYYHYPDNDLIISTGDVFTIEIIHNDIFTTSTTVVPEMPINVTISSATMEIPDFSDLEALRDWRKSGGGFDEITVTWGNEDDSWYYVTLKNVEDNPQEINSFFPERLRDFVFPPINDDTYNIRLPFLTHLGMHHITVYKVNQEYVDLYESRKQDSRDLNEPLTNIENGLGVFSAFNSQTVNLNVVQIEGDIIIE